MQQTNFAIETGGLTHWYAKAQRPALAALNLAVTPGEIYGVLGPNGGGKTTLFRILATLLQPTEGSGTVFGIDLLDDPAAVRRQLGVVFQSPSVDDQLTATEHFIVQGGLYGIGPSQSKQRGLAWLDRLGLRERANERLERFSGGMRRRVELAKALMHRPRLLLMDEPSAGLDPAAHRQLWAELHRLRTEEGLTIVLTTHGMDEAERCDRLAILSRGRVVAEDRPDQLKAMIGGKVLTLEPATNGSNAEKAEGPGEENGGRANLEAMAEEVQRVLQAERSPDAKAVTSRIVDGRLHVDCEAEPNHVATLFNALPNRFQSITVSQPTLEDVFMRVTGSSLEHGEADSR